MKSVDVKAIYDESYFLEAVDGCDDFARFDGAYDSLFDRYRRNISLLGLRPEHSLMEIGCGRGEVCIYHGLAGGKATGVDYSPEAIGLARKKASDLGVAVEFIEASFDQLPEDGEFYDRILASEFIEHICAQEGEAFFRKAHSLLKPDGRLLVFTMPNTLQRRFGYPLSRLWAALHGRRLPKQQPDTLSRHYRLYHLNEQNYFSLRKFVENAGFTNYRIGYDVDLDQLPRGKNARIRYLLARTPLRHILLSNLYVIAER